MRFNGTKCGKILPTVNVKMLPVSLASSFSLLSVLAPLFCLSLILSLFFFFFLSHALLPDHTHSDTHFQTEELVKALQDLENAASGDAAVRQKIASLPQEVQDVSLLEKITGKSMDLQLSYFSSLWKHASEFHSFVILHTGSVGFFTVCGEDCQMDFKVK